MKYDNSDEWEKQEQFFNTSVKVHQYIKHNYSDSKGVIAHYKLKYTSNIPGYVDKSKARNCFFSIGNNSIYLSDNKLKEDNSVKSINIREISSEILKQAKDYKFNIISLELVLFNSNIGFLIAYFDINETDIHRYMEGNYILQALKSDKINNILFLKKIGIRKYKDDQGEDKMISKYEIQKTNLLDIFDYVLKDIDINSFIEKGSYNAKGNKDLYYPVESLVYSLLLLDKDTLSKNEIKKNLNLISKGYKTTYKVSEKDIETAIIEGFNNLRWSISREGVACISSLGDDDKTNEFLKSSMELKNSGAIVNVYFQIYLLLLNQRYTLISIAESINNELGMYDIESEYEKVKESLLNIRNSITKFSLNGIYFDISSNSQYHRYYTKLRQILGIEELLKELNLEINGLDTISSLLKENSEEKKQKKIKVITSIVSFVTALTIANDLSEVVKNILEELRIDYSMIPVTTLVTLFLAIGSIIAAYIVNRITERS